MDHPGNQRNYARELQTLISALPPGGDRPPTLLLHACCAPCASAVLEYLSDYFDIFLLFYNPNIAPREEYDRRLHELERLAARLPMKHPARLLPCRYDGPAFDRAAAGLEAQPEGGARCLACYRLRLEEAARTARRLGLDYFTTTLSISPLKNARALNRIGEELEAACGVKHLPADFKKREGYKRSVELSREYKLYRQDHCGCRYSKAEAEDRRRPPIPQERTE